jgi:hypothetical protein
MFAAESRRKRVQKMRAQLDYGVWWDQAVGFRFEDDPLGLVHQI